MCYQVGEASVCRIAEHWQHQDRQAELLLLSGVESAEAERNPDLAEVAVIGKAHTIRKLD